MKSTKLVCAGIAAILVAVTPATASLIPVSDSYVSAAGDDGNTCDITAPCKSMAQAVHQTKPGGVLHCLDSNGYGGAVLTQSITIDCSNTTAGGGSLIVNGPGITVHIRGLNIWFLPSTMTFAITFLDGAALYVENCLIFGAASGIQFSLTAAANLFVVNSTIRNSGSGVLLKPAAGGSVTATFNGVTIDGNSGGGLKTDTTNGPVSVDISNSTISDNAGNGMNAVSGAGGTNMLNIKNSVIARNGSAGVQANGANAAALVNNTLLDSNTAGATSAVSGGRILTYGNNSIVGTPGSGFTGPAPLQ